MKALIVGCGFMGRMHAHVYGRLDGVVLAGVVDRKPEVARAFGAEFGVPAFTTLTDGLEVVRPDLVDVCLPTDCHRDATIQALEADCHVFCEKPMALTLEDADAMIAAATQADRQLMVGHCIRFWPEYVRLKEAVDSGELGALRALTLTRYGAFPTWSSDNWLADPRRAGGGVLDMHIHDLDFALYLLGEPSAMRADGVVDARGPGYATTLLDYPETTVVVEGGWTLPAGSPFRMGYRAIFSHGAMIWEGSPMTIYRDDAPPETPEFPKMAAAGGGNIDDLGGYYHELKYFTDCLKAAKPVAVASGEQARNTLAWSRAEIDQILARRAG